MIVAMTIGHEFRVGISRLLIGFVVLAIVAIATGGDDEEGDVMGNAMRYIIGLLFLVIAIAVLGAIAATAVYSADTGLGKISILILGGVGGVIGWIVTHYVAKPILRIDDECRNAIQVAEARTFMRNARSDDIRDASQAIGNDGTTLRSCIRTSTWPVRLYCQWRGYNLDDAVRMMFRLGQIAGDERYSDNHRQDHLDYLYICLNAHSHLTPERVAKLKQKAATMKRSP